METLTMPATLKHLIHLYLTGRINKEILALLILDELP